MIVSLGAVGSTSHYPSRLRSINLRPNIQGPTTGSGTGSSTADQSGSRQKPSSQPGVSESTPRNGSESRGTESLSPSGFAPSRPTDLIGNQFPEKNQPNPTKDQQRTIPGTESSSRTRSPSELTPAERRRVQELKRIDAKVRAHEQAHLAAAGQYAQGGISYETKTGPDGNEYAVAGEVSLDTGKAETPRETIQKMRQVKAAALAPANPSPQDQSIAAEAAQALAEARRKQSTSSGENSSESESPSTSRNSDSNSSRGFEGPEDFGAGSTDGSGGQNGISAAGPAAGYDASGSSGRSDPANQATPRSVTGRPGRVLNLLA